MTDSSSELWKTLSDTLFAKVDDAFIRTFREPGRANSRLAAWDPFDPTLRYFKFMLYRAAERQPDRFFDLYREIGRVDIGNPVSVKVRSCAINIDYLFSVEEFLFLEDSMDLSSVRSVVEIGAGFGRTCHAILSLCPQLERYTIVDLPNMLNLSRLVLAQVVPKAVSKVHFVNASDREKWRGLGTDLAINIDSFQEMRASVIDGYFQGIIANCRYFYLKNPIAKYRPESIGIRSPDPERLLDVFELGYCRDVIDIFDDSTVAEARLRYLEAYRPSGKWRLVRDRPLDLFHYLHHALYARADEHVR
jgi:putative sugar O-methyltransferase